MGVLLEKLKDITYRYRYDIFSIFFIVGFIIWFWEPLFSSGHVVFSDMAFGFTTERYLEEIYGLWNERWSTSTLLNVPRLVYILPFWLLSAAFGYSGPVLIKSFMLGLIIVSALSMYLFTKRIVSIYFTKEFHFYKIFALVSGALFYALNPWVLFRVQHIYLLCGYSLFPLLLRLFFDIIDPRFQEQRIAGYSPFRLKPYRENISDLFQFSIVYSISAAAIHYFFYGAIYFFIIGVLIVGKNIVKYRHMGMTNIKFMIQAMVIKLSIMVGIFGFVAFHWLGNYLASFILKTQASQHNINAIETLGMFSRNSEPKNVLYFISYWWPMFDLSSIPISFYLGGGILLLFISIGALTRVYKYHIVAFFSLLSLFFIILATGTEVNGIDDIFIAFVTKTPIIGAMFRDPNKLIGLLAVGFSLLLTFGLEEVLMCIEDTYWNFSIKGGIVLIVIVSMWYYNKPLRDEFVNGFYKPVEIPREHLDISKSMRMKETLDSRVLYLPIADNMTQSQTGVATPIWNRNSNVKGFVKATGDIHIYSTKKNTIFHHEGNIPELTYYLNYTQHLLDKGYSSRLGETLSVLPVDEIAYHKEYKGQERRQEFNLEMLDIQKKLSKHHRGDIYTLYDIDGRDYMSLVSKRVYTPYGYTKFDTYNSIPNFTPKDQGIVFTNLDYKSPLLYEAREGDYLETIDFDDIFLSNLPKENYIFPFDHIETSNIFLNWGKVMVKNPDWLWILSSQGIGNNPFEFSMGRGVAVTFATSRLNLPPHKVDGVEGRLIADFDSLLKTEKFFKPDNPQFFSVQPNPRKNLNNIPVLRGQVAKGDPKDVWQVAKSGYLRATEDTPYQFNLVVSGRGSNKLHLKARFYDSDMNEIGVSYVVAPKEEFFFDEMNFQGEYISPPKTAYMRLDILTFQNINQKLYWWIHDIRIEELSEYKEPNTIDIVKKSDIRSRGDLYMRTYVGKTGIGLNVSIGDKEYLVDTYSESTNSFKWIKVGKLQLEIGENIIKLRSAGGFNAVNALAFIPDDKRAELEFPTRRLIKKTKHFVSLEAEVDMVYKGNIQSERSYPRLSLGRGMRIDKGSLSKEIEVLRSGNYTLALDMEMKPEYRSKLFVDIIDESGNLAYTDVIKSSEFQDELLEKYNKDQEIRGFEIEREDKKEVVVRSEHTRSDFLREMVELEGYLTNYKNIELRSIPLKKGRYTINLRGTSRVPSVAPVKKIEYFDPSRVRIPEFLEDIFQEDCSECEFISPHMTRIKNSRRDDILIEYDATCSCDWYVYSTNDIDVRELDEYLVTFKAKSENIRKRHIKVYFLDEEREIVKTSYIQEVEEQYKRRWNDYSQIIEVPKRAKTMMVHIWARGDLKKDGYLHLKDFRVQPFNDLMLIDKVTLVEGDSYNRFFKDEGMEKEKVEVEYERVDTMKRNVSIKNPQNKWIMVSYGESPNPLWKESYEGKRVDKKIDGVASIFTTNKSGKGEIKIVQRALYYLGLISLIVGILMYPLYIVIERYIRRKNGKDNSSIK